MSAFLVSAREINEGGRVSCSIRFTHQTGEFIQYHLLDGFTEYVAKIGHLKSLLREAYVAVEGGEDFCLYRYIRECGHSLARAGVEVAQKGVYIHLFDCHRAVMTYYDGDGLLKMINEVDEHLIRVCKLRDSIDGEFENRYGHWTMINGVEHHNYVKLYW